MISISAQSLGKRFQFEWIIRNFNYNFQQQNHYALLGNNGSGKSTLMLLLSGYYNSSAGKLIWKKDDNELEVERWFKHFAIASPALELIEEFTLHEHIHFQKAFKPFIENMDEKNISELIGLGNAKHKAIKHYSSGMRQRVKLALAMLSDVPVLMLDEPTTNLDEEGVRWYRMMVEKYSSKKLLLIASNLQREYEFCSHQISMNDWK